METEQDLTGLAPDGGSDDVRTFSAASRTIDKAGHHVEAVGSLLDGVRVLAAVDRTNAEMAVRALYEVTGKLLNVRPEVDQSRHDSEGFAKLAAAILQLRDEVAAAQSEVRTASRTSKQLAYAVAAAAAIAAIPAALYVTGNLGTLRFALMQWLFV
jgi:hypothetical protein